MAKDWESHLERWSAAGVIDADAALRIRSWEAGHARSQGLRWPTILALAFGAILLAAGVLLFVSAHWDELSPAERMSLVVGMVALFHAAGAAVAERFENLSIALHTVGTAALGAGIALAGQIFHLSEHWPAAVLLWAIGAAAAWALLRHWTQAALTAILVPYWLAGEWTVWIETHGLKHAAPVPFGICALAFAYLAARRGARDGTLRKALAWIGGIALLPAAAFLAAVGTSTLPDSGPVVAAWAIAALAPLAVAFLLRGRDAMWTAIAMLWALVLAFANDGHSVTSFTYAWCALGSVGLAAWGIRDSRAERINLGILGFAVTVLVFYFSSVMDKLGRSASLMLVGLLFLGGGWLLERTRRNLIARIRPEVV